MNTPKARRRLVSPSDKRRQTASRLPGVAFFAFVVAPAIRYGTAPRKGFVPLMCSVWFRAYYVDIHTINVIILIKSEEEPHNARGRQSIRFIL